MTFGISAQGTIVAVSPDPLWPDAVPQGGAVVYTDIAELGDLTPPGLSRNPIETTTHNEQDDRFIVGIRRKGDMSMNINFQPQDPTHNDATGLIKKWFDGSRNIYRVTFPDGSFWIFSGWVTNFEPDAPVDDRLSADVTIRPTGGTEFGEV